MAQSLPFRCGFDNFVFAWQFINFVLLTRAMANKLKTTSSSAHNYSRKANFKSFVNKTTGFISLKREKCVLMFQFFIVTANCLKHKPCSVWSINTIFLCLWIFMVKNLCYHCVQRFFFVCARFICCHLIK